MLLDAHLFSISKDSRVKDKKVRTFVISLEHDEPFEVITDITPLNDCKIYKSFLENERLNHMEKLWKLYEYAERTTNKPIGYLAKSKKLTKLKGYRRFHAYWTDLQEDGTVKLPYHEFVLGYTKKWNNIVRLKIESWEKE